MLTYQDMVHCEKCCFRIMHRASSEKTALKNLKKFRYKTLRLNNNECKEMISVYKKNYGNTAFRYGK